MTTKELPTILRENIMKKLRNEMKEARTNIISKLENKKD